MAKRLNLAEIFTSDAGGLRRAREEALRIHSTDIRAAGNQVEQAVRDYFRRMLPARYYVTHGHLIDTEHCVSPQLDIIIADNMSLPSLLTTKDGTEYVPATSALAIGEVKSTYYSSQNYYEKVHRVLVDISEMNRPLVENTFHDGLKPSTTISDSVLGSRNKFMNNLYAFFMCVDGGDFDFGQVKSFLSSVDPSLLPNMSMLLNKGVVLYGKSDEVGGIDFHKYPIEVERSEYDWCFAEGTDTQGGSAEGAHLATLYGALISHLSNSHLDPPSAYRYTSKISGFRRSSLIWAKDRTD